MAQQMTTLQAVNRIVRVIGEPPFPALDTGGTSVAAEAETLLDEMSMEIQTRGWHENTRRTTISPPDVEIAVSGGSGTFTDGETVTETTSGATGRFHQIDADGNMELTVLTGTFTGGETLTGGTSGGTRTGAGTTVLTEGEIVVDDAVIRIDTTAASASMDVCRAGPSGNKLYDRYNETYIFSDDLTISQTILLSFTALTPELQALIVAHAKVEFNQTNEQDRTMDAFLQPKLDDAEGEAARMDMENADLNMLTTPHVSRISGHSTYPTPMR